MRRSYFLFILLAATALSLHAQAIMPLAEVKPGMAGVCRTVFRGDRPEEFPMEVVDIMRNFYPKRSLILIRLKGEKAEHTGVAAGMSGSPIYIDGKIIGALSYSVGIFLREPLAGVTPIEEMLEIFSREDTRDRELAAFVPPAPNKFLEMALGLKEISWENFVPQELLQRRAAMIGTIRPLDLPLAFGGLQPQLVDVAANLLKPAGFRVMSSGTGAGSASLRANASAFDAESAALLQPGAAIGAVLMTGDADIEAIGTVSYRQGDRVLAFGHPFFDNGPVEMPISLARILLIIPSDFGSQKMGESVSLVGTLRQDRTTGIYGVIGAPPALTPMVVRYRNEAGTTSQFEFQFTEERTVNTLMPLIMRFVLVNALESARLATGENSLQLSGSIQLQSGQKIALEDFYPGFKPISGFSFLNGILQSTGEVASLVGAIMANNFQPAQLARVDLNFASVSGRRSATIEQVWIDRNEVEPGDTITVFARLKAFQGPEKLYQQRLAVPKNAEGKFLTINIGGGDEITQVDLRTAPGRFVARNFQQLLALLQDRRRNDFLYVQLRQPDQGLIIEGEQLSSLPPSVYSILQSQNLRGNSTLVREQVLSETRQSISFENAQANKPFAVSGLKMLRLKLR
jgi:hypothetical protein